MRPGLLPFLEERDRHVAEPLGNVGMLLEQLPETERAREPGGPGPHDEDADLDALVRGIGRLTDELAGRERRREVGRPGHDLRCCTSSVSFGTISCTSPTTPRSENSKIGAF